MTARSGVRRLLAGGVRFTGYSASWLLRQLALAAGLSLLLSVAVRFALSRLWLQLPFWQVWLVLTTLLVLIWVLRPLDERQPRLVSTGDHDDGELGNQPYPQLARWERRLSVTEGDLDWYTTVVRDRVAALVSVRLRQRYGFSLAADPARARAVLGDELYAAVTGPVSHTPTPAQVSRLVERIEEI